MQIENLTLVMERILKLAEIEAGKDKCFIGTEHVLIGMMLEGNNGGNLMLKGAGFTVDGLRKCESPNAMISHTASPVGLASRGSLDGLNYALNIVRGRRVLRRTPDYLAAVDEMEIFLLAAIERVENGEPMSAVATVQ